MKKPSRVRANDSWQDALQACARELRERFGPVRRLLLVQAPGFLFDMINPEVVRNRGYYAYPPAGLQRLATSLSRRDIEVQILDLIKCIARDKGEHMVIIGLAGETWKETRQTVRFAESSGADCVKFNAAVPLHGTRMYEMAREMGVLGFSGDDVSVDWCYGQIFGCQPDLQEANALGG